MKTPFDRKSQYNSIEPYTPLLKDPVLELNALNKMFSDKNGHVVNALKQINLKVYHGECVGIVGESGSGKSTLARVICHLTRLTSGTMKFQGNDTTSLNGKALKKYYQNVQMIFQDPLGTFSPRMKIGDYMIEPFINFKLLSPKSAKERAVELVEKVGLDAEFMERLPSMLSGGQLQRVVIARAIGLKPELIVCDECTSALDATIQKQIIELFQALRKETGFTSIFITHDLALAESICDKIHVMYNGNIVESLQGNNISKEANHPYTLDLLNSVFSIDTQKQTRRV
jgi:ABC-type oligopeptide transport system ATPase subunit